MVTLPDAYAVIPTEPGPCSADVVSVAVVCQAPGSTVDAGQTFSPSMVGSGNGRERVSVDVGERCAN
jgi:hypothetical protein